MSAGDMIMAGDGSIGAGTGVDVDIAPPSTVKVGKPQAAELAGMSNELKRKLRDITAEQLEQEPKLKKGRLQCALLLRGVQFNVKYNQDGLRQQLLASLGVGAGRLDKVPMEIAAGPSIDASTDALEQLAQGMSKGLTFQEMSHNVRALFLSNAHDLPKTPALLKKILADIEKLEAALQGGSSGEEMPIVHKCVQQLLEIECPVKRQAYTNCMRLEIEAKMDSAKKAATAGTGGRHNAPTFEAPHPVLIALGTRGRLRVLWEYFKAYSDKTPVYGQAAAFSHEFGSYISDLHVALKDVIDPEIVKKTAEMR
jgi:hypothetical protein